MKTIQEEKAEKEAITAYSSCGTVVTDPEGNVIPSKSELSDYLLKIKKLNITEARKFLKINGMENHEANEFDILLFGYWDKNDKYELPTQGWRDDLITDFKKE